MKNVTAQNDVNLELKKRYLDVLQHQRRLSLNTVSAYGRDLDILVENAAERAASELNDGTLRRFVATLHSQGLNPRSISRTVSAWRGFYDWLVTEGVLANNPLLYVKAPKKAKPLPNALSVDDATALVSQSPPDQDPALQACNQAMFELFYSSGLRVSELASLDVRYYKAQKYESASWLNKDDMSVTVTGKGSKQRTVPVGSKAMAAINRWLTFHTPPPGNVQPLFLNTKGERIAVRTIQLRIKAHGKALGLNANIHPHMMRHTFASHMLQGSGDLRAVQELLGHASIASTQVYTALDMTHLAAVYDKAHPRAKIK